MFAASRQPARCWRYPKTLIIPANSPDSNEVTAPVSLVMNGELMTEHEQSEKKKARQNSRAFKTNP